MIEQDALGFLGLEPSCDATAVRRAYADRLKQLDVDRDPDAFARLREARDLALQFVGGRNGASNGAAKRQDAPTSVEADEPAPEPDAGYRIRHPTLAMGASGDGIGVPLPFPFSPATFHEPDETVRAASGEAAAAEAAPPWWDPPEIAGPVPPGIISIRPGEQIRHDLAVYEILLADQEKLNAPLTAAEEEALRFHLAGLFDEASAADVSVFQQVEEWIAESLARSCPRSDPVLAQVSGLFGWAATAGQIGQLAAIQHVTDRLGALEFLAEVQQRDHYFHRAWKELTTPARDGSRRGIFFNRNRVHELLNRIRRHYPTLESEFDGHRVAIWEGAEGNGCGTGWVIVIAILMLVKLLTALGANGDDTSRYSEVQQATGEPAPALTNAEDDIVNVVVATFDTQTTESKLRENPTLYAFLEKEWQIANDLGVGKDQFASNMRRQLLHRHEQVWRHAPLDLVEDLQELRLEQALVMQSRGWDACDAFFAGKSLSPLPEELIDRELELAFSTVLSVKSEPAALREERTFRIPPRVVQALMTTTGLTKRQLSDALLNGGSTQERCVTWIALLKLALDDRTSGRETLLRSI